MIARERTRGRHDLRVWTFAGSAAAVYAAAATVASALPGLARPGPVAVALTLDLVVVVPLLFHLLVVRARGLPLVTLAPVVAAGVGVAALLLPKEHEGALHVVELLLVPVEVAVVAWIVRRAARAARHARDGATGDPVERILGAAREILGHERAAALAASEVAVLHYALASWRARPHAPAGTAGFAYHRRSGHGGIVAAFLLVLAVEGAAVHLLAARFSPLAAWLLTAGTIYAALWLVADWRATVLRPVLVDGEDGSLLLRAGLRWTVRVPRAAVVEVLADRPDLGRARLDLTLLGRPSHWIVLAEAVEVHGPYGVRRLAHAIGVQPDDPEGFSRALG